MKYTADYLIKKRIEKWNSNSEETRLQEDKKLRDAIANELIINEKLREEVQKSPEKLIELLFYVVDKEQKTVPFILNDVQEDFIGKLNKAKADFKAGKIVDISLLVLKGRQQGFTTLITAYQLACTILNKNFQGFTVADEASNTEAIFQNKAKFPYDQLPEAIKPTEKFNNKRQLLFEKLNSSWQVDTATANMGRSRTVNFFHGSECAFWRDGIALIQAGIGEAFTKNCIKIYESTANGFNDFKAMWDSGTNINCFYEWWRTPEYRLNIPTTERKEFLSNLKESKEWIFDRLRWLKNAKKLDLKQLYWYYNKYNNYIDKELIKQEYPCTPEEAFLASGNCVFDKEAIIRRIAELKEPLKQGYFSYKYNGIKITNIKWQDDPNGPIKIYKLPKKNYPYVLSGDTAGEGSDFFTSQVIDNTTGEQVAVYKDKVDEVEYTKQIYCLAKYYKDALVGIETNFSNYPQLELERLGYKNFYVRKVEDTIPDVVKRSFGFKTTSLTRPIILGELKRIVKENIDKINDKDTLEEMLVFIKNDKGREEAQVGYHDDLVMALAIVYYIRDQQKTNVDVKETRKEFYNFDFEKPDGYDSDLYSEEVVI